MMTDPIADMLTRIRNAVAVRKPEVTVPFSKIKKAIAAILVREGYLESVSEIKNPHPALALTLKYVAGASAIQHVQKMSTPGHRRYIKNGELPKVLNGLGIAILSTPRGLLTDSEARAAKVGGELICLIY